MRMIGCYAILLWITLDEDHRLLAVRMDVHVPDCRAVNASTHCKHCIVVWGDATEERSHLLLKELRLPSFNSLECLNTRRARNRAEGASIRADAQKEAAQDAAREASRRQSAARSDAETAAANAVLLVRCGVSLQASAWVPSASQNMWHTSHRQNALLCSFEAQMSMKACERATEAAHQIVKNASYPSFMSSHSTRCVRRPCAGEAGGGGRQGPRAGRRHRAVRRAEDGGRRGAQPGRCCESRRQGGAPPAHGRRHGGQIPGGDTATASTRVAATHTLRLVTPMEGLEACMCQERSQQQCAL